MSLWWWILCGINECFVSGIKPGVSSGLKSPCLKCDSQHAFVCTWAFVVRETGRKSIFEFILKVNLRETEQSLAFTVMELHSASLFQDVVIYREMNLKRRLFPPKICFHLVSSASCRLFLSRVGGSSAVWSNKTSPSLSSPWFRVTLTLQLWGSWVCSNPTRMFHQIYMSLTTDTHTHTHTIVITFSQWRALAVLQRFGPLNVIFSLNV